MTKMMITAKIKDDNDERQLKKKKKLIETMTDDQHCDNVSPGH